MNYYWLAEQKGKTERWAELQTNKEYLIAEIHKFHKEKDETGDKAEKSLPAYAVNIYKITMEGRIKMLETMLNEILFEINDKEGGH